METRKQTKSRVVAEVAAEKARRKERSAELAAMTPEDRAAAKASNKAAAKASAKQRKADVKAMTGEEKKLAKRHDRMYRKVWHRPRRAVGWIAVLLVVALIASFVTPYVRDLSRLFDTPIDSSTAAGKAARENAAVVAEQISDEGIVLLSNDGTLPLRDKGVNVFGFSSFALRYGGGGSGGADQSSSKNLYQGLTDAGVAYNETLYDFMIEQGADPDKKSDSGLLSILLRMFSAPEPDEPEATYLSDVALAQAKEYSDVALVVVGNDGVEASDFTTDQLRMPANTKALLDRVTGAFDKVIVVVNSGNTMELGFLNEYPQIVSSLWIGTPGPMGAVSLGKVIAGDVNPSGHLTDTYAYDVTTAPAAENFGDYKYDNIKGRALINYEEGIYVGYRYYETRYLDDEPGYAAAVQFPFGHGLSYTDFDWKPGTAAVTGDEVSVPVEVTNTRDAAGKDVVQVYFSAPYTEGGIEKSAIELAGFAKTSDLAPGQSQTVTVTFPVRDMSSYDMADRQAYVLEAGDYAVKVGHDVHDVETVLTHTVATDVVYDTDEVTGTKLENRFGYADGDLTYLSRSDWAGTYPDGTDTDLTASDALLAAMAERPAKAEGDLPTFGADNGIALGDLKGAAYDDPRWEQFLDQFTLEELMDVFERGAYKTQDIERLGVPSAVLLDGPAGINFLFGKVTAASYPTEAVISATWNEDLARQMGDAVGQEANAYGVHGWYAPGMNLHRTAQGGRNFEYYSEDPLLSGRIAAGMTAGAEERNVIVFIKHFVVNDQETNARSSINVFLNEQAMRELYLRPFEITVKEAAPRGAMSSFSHIGHKWAGGNPELLGDVLRDEWGFEGLVSTDAVLGDFMDPTLAVRHGNDLMLDMLTPTGNIKKLKKAYQDDPVGIANGLRDRVHTTLFVLLQTELDLPE